MFIGQHEHNVDAKHRMNIPSKFRESIESSDEPRKLFITLGLDSCLFVYTSEQWQEVTATLKTKSFTDRAARNFKRLFFSNAGEVDIDKQGRILLPENLMEAAGLTKEVTIVGVGDRMEVWDRDRWNTMKEASGEEYESLAEQLF